VRVLTRNSTGRPGTLCEVRVIESLERPRSRSDHFSPVISPRRLPGVRSRV
jgi:hypothetical protein